MSRYTFVCRATTLASFLLLSCAAAAQGESACAFKGLDRIDFTKSKPSFEKEFCEGRPNAACALKYDNIADLVMRMSKDSRIPTIGTASYILATVALETGSKNFSPATTEAIGPAQRKRSYYPDYIGRGWVQLTYKDKYLLAGEKLHLDLVGNPELALKPDNSYQILVAAMTEGWLETYRASSKGAGGSIPIRLGDFVSKDKVDYGSARAVINANCMKKPCTDVEYSPGKFIPSPANLDNGEYGQKLAQKFERLLCMARPE